MVPVVSCQATSCLLIIQVRRAAMSFSVQRRSMASKPNWTRESRSLPLGTYCNTGDFRWVYSIWSRTEGNWWAPHKRNSAEFERRGSQMQVLERRGPFGNWNALKSGNYSLRLRAEQRVGSMA